MHGQLLFVKNVKAIQCRKATKSHVSKYQGKMVEKLDIGTGKKLTLTPTSHYTYKLI